ncbi:hypothetical protein [Saprospira grandis]|uniref:hypothetical protein n=1 Tax=Saprospira grandis TaxID=1008 RepID=UPI0022DD4A00|nr:hypothetical protein [Saprospira grandis]WBM74577.1 hypothetical protein OP864_16460 [Saprospira grandis]
MGKILASRKKTKPKPPKKNNGLKKLDERMSDAKQCGAAADPAKNLFFCAGPSEQRAAQRSDPSQRRGTAPKKIKKIKTVQIGWSVLLFL